VTLHVANDRLTALIDVDVLNSDNLRATISETPE
jgi:hypothetical protein